MARTKRRSWLLVPPFEDAVEEALGHDPDVLVLDMVELIPPEARAQAVKGLAEVVEQAVASRSVEVFLQVNVNRMSEELEAGIRPGVSGVVMPRLEWRAYVRQADAVLSRLEKQHGISVGSLQVVVSLDTALGNHRAMELIQASTKGLGRQPGAGGPGDGPAARHRWRISPSALSYAAADNLGGGCRSDASGRVVARTLPGGLMAPPTDTYQAAVRGKALGFRGAFCVAGEQAQALNRGFDGEGWEETP